MNIKRIFENIKNKLPTSKKGQIAMGGLPLLFIALGVSGIVLIIIFLIVGSITAQLDTSGISAAANVSLNSAVATLLSALGLAAIAITIGAAGLLLFALFSFGGFGGGGGGRRR